MSRARLLRAGGGPIIIGIVLALIAGTAWMARAAAEHYIATARNREINRTAEEGRESVLALRETVSRTLDQIDGLQGLASLVVHARHSGNQAMERDALAELTRLRGIMGTHVRQIAAINPAGYLEWTNVGKLDTPVFAGDREHFQVIANGSARTFISAPLTGRAARARVIDFTKGVYDTDGRLLAVTVVSVEPAAFSGLAPIVGIAGNDAITIQRTTA